MWRRRDRPRPPDERGCDVWRAHVSDYVDATISPELGAAMAAHLSVCPRCRAEVELERRLREHMRTDGLVSPPPALADRLVSIGGDLPKTVWMSASAVDRLPSRRRRRRRITAATIGTLTSVVVLLVVVGWTLAPDLPRVTSARGMAVQRAAVVPVSATADPFDCPSQFGCPPELAGLPLVDLTVSADAVLLLYASDGSVVAVVEQWGVLDDAGPAGLDPTVASLAWQNGDIVYAVSASSLLLATTAESELPHAPVPDESLMQRVSRGLKRLAGH